MMEQQTHFANHLEKPRMNTDTQGELRLIACPHPLSIELGRIDRMVPEGATVAEHIRALGWSTEGLGAVVFIDEQLVPFAQWEYAVPKAGQNLSVRVIPMGGGGSENGKTALRIVAMLAVVLAAAAVSGGALSGILPEALGMAFASGTTAASVAAGLITVAGMLAVTAKVPPARPRFLDHRKKQHV